MKKEERRKHIRINAKSRVDLKIKNKTGRISAPEEFTAIVTNLSVDGICFASDVKLDPGTKVELELSLEPNSKPLHISGEAVWSRPGQENQPGFDTGVKLFTVEKDDENRFITYVCDKMVENFSQYLRL